ncbi:MAG: site-specific integrase, partial [Terriglobia bacterium]
SGVDRSSHPGASHNAERAIRPSREIATMTGRCFSDMSSRRFGISSCRTFRGHSMRHTFLTYNGVDGVAMPILQSLAGHTNAQTTLGYIDPFSEHKRAALERWVKQLFPFVPSLRGSKGKKGT